MVQGFEFALSGFMYFHCSNCRVGFKGFRALAFVYQAPRAQHHPMKEAFLNWMGSTDFPANPDDKGIRLPTAPVKKPEYKVHTYYGRRAYLGGRGI